MKIKKNFNTECHIKDSILMIDLVDNDKKINLDNVEINKII